jgi:predicted nucleic-acid-binding protein
MLFLNDLKQVIENILNINCIVKEKQDIKGIDSLNIYGNNKTKVFLDWIYNDAELKLNRKYLHYIESC